jgi:hypothetical protein
MTRDASINLAVKESYIYRFSFAEFQKYAVNLFEKQGI